jgi:hypothetical protein
MVAPVLLPKVNGATAKKVLEEIPLPADKPTTSGKRSRQGQSGLRVCDGKPI